MWWSLWSLLLFADLIFLLQWWQNICERVVWLRWGQRESQTWCVWEVSPGALDVPKSCCYGISSLFLCTKFQLCYFCPEKGDIFLSLLINPTQLFLQHLAVTFVVNDILIRICLIGWLDKSLYKGLTKILPPIIWFFNCWIKLVTGTNNMCKKVAESVKRHLPLVLKSQANNNYCF